MTSAIIQDMFRKCILGSSYQKQFDDKIDNECKLKLDEIDSDNNNNIVSIQKNNKYECEMLNKFYEANKLNLNKYNVDYIGYFTSLNGINGITNCELLLHQKLK